MLEESDNNKDLIEKNQINFNQINPGKKLTFHIENYYKYYFLTFFIIIFFFLVYGFIRSLLKKFDIIIICSILFGLFINIMIIFIMVKYNANKIELLKDEKNNLLHVQKYNLLCLKKNIIDFTLENTILDLIVDKGKEMSFYHLLIINIFKNKSEIDLDNSNIKNKPVKIYYLIKNIAYQKGLNKESLNNFLGISSEIENPIIDLFSGIQLSSNFDYHIKQYIKISNTFSSYYFKGPFMDDILLYTFLVLSNLSCLIASFIYTVKVHKISGIIIGIILLIVLIIIDIYFITKRLNRIKRIDIIYSHDFKRMFIGLVKYYEKSYIKTFIFDVNAISKFENELDKKSKKTIRLIIRLKDETFQEICIIKTKDCNLAELLSILNEKIEV